MKPITKVFLVIAALVLSLVIWGLFFNTGGVLETAYNAMIAPVNTAWSRISGTGENLLPVWTITNSDKVTDGTNETQGGLGQAPQ